MQATDLFNEAAISPLQKYGSPCDHMGYLSERQSADVTLARRLDKIHTWYVPGGK